MIEPKIPADEAERLETLRALKILDSSPEERFDRLTRMAKRMFGVPISLVSIVDSDRQWFKSAQGLDATETPRDISFCGHAILGNELFLIPNAKEDERFHDNPLVTDAPNIRFYAGCPLRVANGHKMGTLCLIDDKPREMDDEDKALLQDLAVMAEQEIAAIQLATLDELTMISNRRGFMSLAQHSMAMCKRNAIPSTLILFDLNDFKPINDTFGHAEGDRALVAFSNLLKQELRDADVFARLGGDEFVALATGSDEQGVQKLLDRMQTALQSYNREQQRGYDISFSAGFVTSHEHKMSVDEMLEAADSNMYEHKKSRKR